MMRAMDELAFRTLLYRYFFFGWLFRDASRGTRMERAAAWRHNQSQARWLGTYLRRWIVSGLALFAMGALVELVIGAVVLSAFFYVPSVFAVTVETVIGVAWLGLKLLPCPF